MYKYAPLTALALITASLPAAHADDIVTVTATKRPQAIEDVPASITVLEGTAADGVNRFNSAEEITQYLSGVQAAVANGTQIAFQIRGIGAVDHQALTPSAAAVYMDGVFLATNVQTGPLLFDIERVEVLKGPQGSLYGRNASSGAINFISTRPSKDQESYVTASYGRFDRFDLTSAMGGQLSENVSGRLAGRYLIQDAPLENVATDAEQPAGPQSEIGKRKEFALRGTILWSPSDETDLLLRAHYAEDNGVNPAPRNSSLQVSDHQISVGPDGVQDSDNEFFGGAVEVTSRWGDWDVFSLTAIEGYNQQYGFDFDGTQAPFGDPTLNANLSYDRDFVQWSEELHLQKDWNRGHTLIGLMVGQEDFEQTYTIWCGELDPNTLLGTCRYVGAPGRVGPTPASDGVATTLITDIEQDRLTTALFTYNDIDLTGRLTLTVGARYTFENIDGEGMGVHIFDDGTVALNNRDGVGPAQGANEIEENRLTGNLALRFDVSDRAQFYAAFSNGYKSGGFNGEVQNNATHFQDEGLFNAETVNAYEVGYKGQPADNLALTGAVFYQDYQDPQARIFVNFPLPDNTSITSNSLSNLDEADVYGAEATARWTPLSNFDLQTSVTWLDTEIQQSSDGAENADLFDGNPLPFASEWSGTLYGRYEWDLPGQRRISFETHAKYRSEFYLDAEGLEDREQDGYTTVDAELALHFNQFDTVLSLWGRNLTDEDYATSGFGFIGYNTFRSEPMSYGVRVRQRL